VTRLLRPGSRNPTHSTNPTLDDATAPRRTPPIRRLSPTWLVTAPDRRTARLSAWTSRTYTAWRTLVRHATEVFVGYSRPPTDHLRPSASGAARRRIPNIFTPPIQKDQCAPGEINVPQKSGLLVGRGGLEAGVRRVCVAVGDGDTIRGIAPYRDSLGLTSMRSPCYSGLSAASERRDERMSLTASGLV
jgi:hypothetical protein